MKWTQRAVRAVFGILISGAMLTGCSSNQATAPVAQGNPADEALKDSSGKPINTARPR